MIARALTPVDAAAQWTVLGIPWVSFVIIAVEFCERFVFYGMMTQLLLYLEADWGMSDSVAASHVLLFVSTAYFTPLLGGYLADSFFGKHTVIVLFSIVYTLGLFALSLGAFVVRVWPAVAWTLTWSGLLGIAFGTGGIKPCVSTLGACQIDALRGKTEAEADEAMQSYFRWFYWSLNLGALFGVSIMSVVAPQFGFAVTFLIPALLLAGCTVGVWLIRDQCVHVPPAGSIVGKAWTVVWDALHARLRRPQAPARHWLDRAIPVHGQEVVAEVRPILRVMKVFVLLPFFWMLHLNGVNLWTNQGKRMAKPDWLSPAIVLDFNTLSILWLLPLFDRVLFPFLVHRSWFPLPLKRMVLGMACTGASYAIAGAVDHAMAHNPHERISLLWQLPQWLVFSVGEVLTSVTALEFAYTEAPESMKSAVSALFLMTSACAALVLSLAWPVFAYYVPVAEYQYYWAAALLAAPTWVLFRVADTFEYSDAQQDSMWEEHEGVGAQ